MGKEKESFEFLRPDLYHLDEEWLNQPKVFHKWCIRLDKAEKRLDDATTNLKLLEADLDYEIRRHPKRYKLPEKITESMVAQAILRHPKYRKALRGINKRRYRVKVLKSAVNSLHQRKAALEALVTLHGRDYFATPQYPKGDDGRGFKDQMENKPFKHKKKKKKKKKKK